LKNNCLRPGYEHSNISSSTQSAEYLRVFTEQLLASQQERFSLESGNMDAEENREDLN
jgi:hypothetical protein